MASVVTTLLAALDSFGLEGGDKGDPEAIVAGQIDDSIPATGAGDNQFARWRWVLPPSCSYILTGVWLEIRTSSSNALRWENSLFATWRDGNTGVRHPFEMHADALVELDNGVSALVYRPLNLPSQVVLNPVYDAGLWQSTVLSIEGYNVSAEDQLYFTNARAQFLRIGRDQAQFWYWHSPTLTR